MAKSTSFPVAHTAKTNGLLLSDLSLVSDYAIRSDTADQCVLSAKSAPVDQEEVITLHARPIDRVRTNLTNYYPSGVIAGAEYGVKYEVMLSTTDSADPNFRVDNPVVVTVTVREPRSGNLSDSDIISCVKNAVSALITDEDASTPGSWRLGDLRRFAETPVTD